MRTGFARFGLRSGLLVGLLAVLLVVWGLFHDQIDYALGVRFLLSAPSPREEVFNGLVDRSTHPDQMLRRCWNTDKVVHRQWVVNYLSENAASNAPWLDRLDDILVAGTTDPDMSVRELALATLDARRRPQLFECAQFQLKDLDPLLRLLGLEYLKKTDPRRAIPVIVPLLDDPDLRIQAEAELCLMRWSGEDYGVRVKLAMPATEGPLSGQVDPANVERIKRGIEERKRWWIAHSKEYDVHPAPLALKPTATLTSTIPDFTLPDMEGKSIRLSDFRGKVVLLNFWATWCTACLAELPDLVALKKKLGDRVIVLGVLLDGWSAEVDSDENRQTTSSAKNGPSKRLDRSKIDRAVRSQGINYPVLLDPTGLVGSQFNGGELPTTVIVDSQGRMRRRFVGERNLAVFEAMIAEASRPVVSP
jgi:thiol-disulfide isomerase/thioredoxin